MSFPNSISGQLQSAPLTESESQISIPNALQLLKNDLQRFAPSNLELKEDGLEFETRYSLIRFRYSVDLTIKKGKRFELFYRLQIAELSKIVILLLVFTAFFSRFSFNNFLIFSVILVVVFYAVNIWFLKSTIQRWLNILPMLSYEDIPNQEGITQEQQQWIKNPNQCSGCGMPVTVYDLKCPECGLIRYDEIKQAPFTMSKYQHKTIRYHFKPTKDEET